MPLITLEVILAARLRGNPAPWACVQRPLRWLPPILATDVFLGAAVGALGAGADRPAATLPVRV